MKKIALMTIMAVAIVSYNTSAQVYKVVGTLNNGTPVKTVDTAQMLSALNSKLLSLSGIDAQLTNAVIISINGSYYLKFTGSAYKSLFRIIVEGTTLKADASTTCTTSDCASEPHGCEPTLGSGTIYCSPCANNGKCTKISSTGSLLD
jgi:opacity protein-like surface antigen